MILISANPSNPPKRRKTSTKARKAAPKGGNMAKRHRTAAQKAATRKMIAANKRRHHNPSSPKRYHAKRRHSNPSVRKSYKRRVHRNPSLFGGGGVLGELLSKEGLLMVGAAFVAPMAADYIQEKVMPDATGWTKLAVKAGVVLAGAWALDKFLKQRKAALAFAVTGAAVLVNDTRKIVSGVMQGLSASEADMLANRPDLVAQVANGSLGMGDPYAPGMSDPYALRLGDDSTGAFNPAFQSSF